jgi:iron(II)-dependent oxidoreductase
MLRRLLPLALAALSHVAVLPCGPAAAQQPPPTGGRRPPGRGKQQPPQQQQRKEAVPLPASKSVWSRLSAPQVPGDLAEPGAEELAAKLDLESIGPQGPDGIVHWRHRRTGMLFVFVPGGAFPMGSDWGDIYNNLQVLESAKRGRADEMYFASEQPQAAIHLSPYFIGVYEVTNGEYRQFLEEWRAGKVAKECEWPLYLAEIDHAPFAWQQPQYPFWGDRQPIVGITWLDAYAFSRWMGGRLPSEAEWEKAARGSDGRIWPWGNHFDPMRANTGESSNRRTLDVGTYPGGRSVFGCYDMAGNVGEYCLDAFDGSTYRYRAAKDPCLVERDPPNELRVIRGGRWNVFGLLHTTRCTSRGQIQMKQRYPRLDASNTQTPVTDYFATGFRVVLSPCADLFPDGVVEQLRAQYRALVEERRKAIERRRAAGGGRAPATGDEPPEDGQDGGGDGTPEGGDGR